MLTNILNRIKTMVLSTYSRNRLLSKGYRYIYKDSDRKKLLYIKKCTTYEAKLAHKKLVLDTINKDFYFFKYNIYSRKTSKIYTHTFRKSVVKEVKVKAYNNILEETMINWDDIPSVNLKLDILLGNNKQSQWKIKE